MLDSTRVSSDAPDSADTSWVLGVEGSSWRVWGLAQLGWRSAVAAATLLAVDWLTMCACLTALWWIRTGILPAFAPELPPVLPLPDTFSAMYALLPWTIAFAQVRLYTRRTLFWDEVRRVLYACSAATLLVLVLSFAGRRVASPSRLIIVGLWFAGVIAVPMARYHAKRLLAAAGLWRKRVLIVGAGDTGIAVCERVAATPDLGYEPVALVDDDPHKIGSTVAGLTVHGPLEMVPSLITELRAKDIVMAMPGSARERLLHVVALCEERVQSIRLVPDLLGLAAVGVEAEELDGVLLLHMRSNLAKPWNLLVKQTFDVLVAMTVTVLLVPVWLAAALAVRLDSPGSIFFVDERLGRGRRPFRCIKFRTMYSDGGRRLETHLAAHPDSRREWERYAKLRSFDPRVTRVGRLLRRSSFDELPQLINVFRGEMSLVGPRPYLPSEIDRIGELADTLSKAPPGITGLWQVSGRNDLSFEQRLRLDEYYVRNWSLWLDVVVLLKTIGAVLWRRGAY